MHKNVKKIQKLLKEYFIFSTGERKGIIALFILLLILIALPYMNGWVFPPKPLDITIRSIPTVDEPTSSVTSNEDIPSSSTCFVFDPNTATDEELIQLGFSAFNVKTIRNYVNKGGRFHTATDLKKIYGVKQDLFKTVEPFIAITAFDNKIKPYKDSTHQYKKVAHKMVELNSADSIELVALYRIGPGLAHRILEYRNKLGGFVSIDQLKEIWSFDEDILYDLQGKITVDTLKVKRYQVNTVSADELKTHPYFKYKLSNAIVNYRLQHGNYTKLEDLKKIVIISDSIYQKISNYLLLD